jgi:hypothetical protein
MQDLETLERVRVLEETSSRDVKEIVKSNEITRLLGYECTLLCVCVCVCVCHSETEREREREREKVCVKERQRQKETENVCERV